MIEKMCPTHGKRRTLHRLVGQVLAAGMMATCLAAPSLAAEPAASVDGATESAIRHGMQRLMVGNPEMKVEQIRPTPIPGLFEVQVGRSVVYADASGKYVLAEGELIDIEHRRNLTHERLTDLSRIDFQRDLPLDKAIKQVHGKGERVLAIFEDPNCSYCRRMRSVLANIDNLTIYTFTYPILAPSSQSKSEKAWCAKDPAEAWTEMMTSGQEPDNAGDCKTPVKDIVALGRRLNVTGTPTLFFPDGHRVPGAISPGQLEQLLNMQHPAEEGAAQGQATSSGKS